MTPTAKCPFCGSTKLVSGRAGENRRGPDYFTPDEADRWAFTFRPVFAFKIGPSATFCGDCCMVWCQADRLDAYKFITNFCSYSLKVRLFGPGGQPPRETSMP